MAGWQGINSGLDYRGLLTRREPLDGLKPDPLPKYPNSEVSPQPSGHLTPPSYRRDHEPSLPDAEQKTSVPARPSPEWHRETPQRQCQLEQPPTPSPARPCRRLQRATQPRLPLSVQAPPLRPTSSVRRSSRVALHPGRPLGARHPTNAGVTRPFARPKPRCTRPPPRCAGPTAAVGLARMPTALQQPATYAPVCPMAYRQPITAGLPTRSLSTRMAGPRTATVRCGERIPWDQLRRAAGPAAVQ